MRILYSLLVVPVTLLFTGVAVNAQDNWVGIQQGVPVKQYAGKKFRYTASAKTDGSAALLAMMGAQVTRTNNEWGYFNHGGDQAVWDTAWTTPTLEGQLDADAATLNLGIVCMGNGSCYFDAARLQIETTPGKWEEIPLLNAGFESAKTVQQVPEGWQFSKPSPHFLLGSLKQGALEGSAALSITGFGNEDNGPVSFFKRIAYARAHYNKSEYYIPMRDGKKLFTAIYTPKDASASRLYPLMLHRTTYSVGPYGENNYPPNMATNMLMAEEGYIFVHQDVRGRYKSEGYWTNMTPHIADKRSVNEVDESTDTWDTIDWLLKNIPYQNGKAGQWGISYPGFYAVAGSINAHPALKAVSPQAPVADYWFDDFHHNGALTQAYFPFFPIVGVERKDPSEHNWFPEFQRTTEDSYDLFRRFGTVKKAADSLLKNNLLWNQISTHSNYDSFWRKRRITDHLKNLKPAYLVVGGWFDAEDLYGTLTTYKEIEKANQGIYNTIVMGPFGHGDWAHEEGHTMHHQLYFGDSIATFYQRNIETRFFHHFLKGNGDGVTGLPEAYMYNTGTREWQTFTEWPSKRSVKQKLYFAENRQLRFTAPGGNSFSEYISDPDNPVPFTMDIVGSFRMTPYNYMSEDQRFASRRPDVLVFETGPLAEDLTLGGEISIKLNVSTTGTDADWVVKVIDVYPDNEPNTPYTPRGVTLSGYEQMVRSEVMRSRWRNSYEKPLPMAPGKITPITFRLQDVLHTFKKGHRLMIQVQSSWFPLIDLNPQKFVPNIYQAERKDFIKATQRVYHGSVNPSYIEVDVLR